ncbi:MAG: hypothetical protein MMC33_008508 [Icmadophila ericetorum]|nr:hypothetical protein [Icmadophila ericetorum]
MADRTSQKLQREIANARGLNFEQVVASPLRAASLEENRPFDTDEKIETRKSDGKSAATSAGKRKYRRHPKPDEHAPERPPSAYVIFSNKVREDLRPENLSFTEIAKRVGEKWQVLIQEEKDPYESQASAAKEKYNIELAKYKKTSHYREYAIYLADFKARNPVISSGGKRPRLETEQSTASSTSTGARSSTSGYDAQRVELGSSIASSIGAQPMINGKFSPVLNMPPPVALSSSAYSSPSSPSPTPPPNRLVTGAQGYPLPQAYAPSEGPFLRGVEPLRPQPLPRIIPLDSSELSPRQASLAPISTDVPLHNQSGTTTNPRRSHHTPAPFLHNDTISSMSSRSSHNISNESQSSGALYSPITPVEEIRSQRTLPPPSSIALKTAAAPYGDSTRKISYPPISSQSIQSQTSNLLPPSQVSPSSSADIPHERQSFMNLSIANTGAAIPRHNLRSHSRELRSAQHPTSLPARQQQQSGYDESHFRQSPTSGQEHRALILRDQEDSADEGFLESSADPLSVLAYAGRIVDRESQNSTPQKRRQS